jgi:phosphopantetheinyl transferase (holo-ACP synthase)
MDHYRGITADGAIAIRERFHAEGNRFAMKVAYHEEQAAFTLASDERCNHIALAAKWALARDCYWTAANTVSDRAGIPEYGEAWDKRLQPHEVTQE